MIGMGGDSSNNPNTNSSVVASVAIPSKTRDHLKQSKLSQPNNGVMLDAMVSKVR